MSNIIGISALFHDSACCLLQDGHLKAAVLEERFTRIKHDASIPANAFKFCLERGSISIADIDCIAFYEDPVKKFSRQLCCGIPAMHERLPQQLLPLKVENDIREILGYYGPVVYFDHHLSHAASSFFFSGFKTAAVMTTDGVGEWATTSYGLCEGREINLFEQVQFPDSIGLLYSTITSYLGFEVNEGEYKVMGLAPYGIPKYAEQISCLIHNDERSGKFSLNMEYFDFIHHNRMFSDALISKFGAPPRTRESKIEQFHKDVARSLQFVLENILLQKVQYLYNETKAANLCLAGGVALNCVANGHIARKGPFEKIFVQPASNDAGGALGAAALAYNKIAAKEFPNKSMRHVNLGPAYNNYQVKKVLDAASLIYHDYSADRAASLLAEIARRLAAGEVIGWFQGEMEFGPRALGARSILADPRFPDMQHKINSLVKKREGFRPFAPAVLESVYKDHFDLKHPSPFMLETCQVVSPFQLPAITHVDNSARVQTVNSRDNPRFHKLIQAFYDLTGCPIVLNTSFNLRNEPIVCSPADALKCFVNSDINCLVMEDCLVDKEENDDSVLKYILSVLDKQVTTNISRDIYTFM